MPIGYLLTIALVTWCTFFALLPIRKGAQGRSREFAAWMSLSAGSATALSHTFVTK